jgi:protocatechuate 3,4-dioxygenase alpha subunit
MSELPLTPSQTVGPFFAPGLLRPDAVRQVLAGPDTPGEPIRLEGQVLDGAGEIVPDALIEIWQADAAGHYNHPVDRPATDQFFLGYGRAGIEKNGFFWFETIKPGAVAFDATRQQAPHINLTIFARGLLNHLATRLYFEDEMTNATDPVLQSVPPPRRDTLIARRRVEDGQTIYRLDIRLQGEGETVFFNL